MPPPAPQTPPSPRAEQKPRMVRSNKTRKMRGLPKYMHTAHGLEGWHKHLFENLGWMVLAKEKGLDYKIATYKKSIHHYLMTSQHVMSEYQDHNRKHDLNVLYKDVKRLKEFVNKNL
jgi:hypothetical protein